MRAIREMIAATALLLTFGTAAEATSVLNTSPFNASGAVLNCNVANVTTKPVTVTVEVIDGGGASPSGPVTRQIAPGAVDVVSGPAPDPAYCRFTVNGNKSSVRAGYCVGDPCQVSGDAR